MLPLLLLSVLTAIVVLDVLHLANLRRRVDHVDQTLAQVNLAQRLFLDSETAPWCTRPT